MISDLPMGAPILGDSHRNVGFSTPPANRLEVPFYQDMQ